MVFELVEAHFRRLRTVVEKGSVDVPWLAAGNTFQWLSLFQSLFITSTPPESRIVIIAARLIWFIWLHLRLTEVLGQCQQEDIQLDSK